MLDHIQVLFKLTRQLLRLLTVLFLQEVSRMVPGMGMLLRDIQRVVLFRQLVSRIGTTTGPMGTKQGVLLQVVLFLQLLSRCRPLTGPSKRMLCSSKGTRL